MSIIASIIIYVYICTGLVPFVRCHVVSKLSSSPPSFSFLRVSISSLSIMILSSHRPTPILASWSLVGGSQLQN